MIQSVGLRRAHAGDAAAIAEIYRPFVTDTAVSFELDPPDTGEVAARMAALGDTHPYLVAEDAAGSVLGFSYAGPFRVRPVYRWTVETSIYLSPEAQGLGVGRQLYGRLLDVLIAQGFHQAVGTITLPNAQSVGFHEAMGFVRTGDWRDIGYKLGEWRQVGVYQRALASKAIPPVEMLGVAEVWRDPA